jgi:hypothetical protein
VKTGMQELILHLLLEETLDRAIGKPAEVLCNK